MHDLFTHNLNVSSWVRWSPPWWLCRPPWRGPGPRGCAWPPEFGHWEFVLLQSASLMRWPGAELCWPLSETGIQSVAAVSIRLYGVMVSVCGVSWDWQRWARPGSSSSCHHTAQYSTRYSQHSTGTQHSPLVTTSTTPLSKKTSQSYSHYCKHTCWLAPQLTPPPIPIFPTHHPHSCWISILRVAECCSQLKIRFINIHLHSR